MQPLLFVILHHLGHGEPHYDLLIQPPPPSPPAPPATSPASPPAAAPAAAPPNLWTWRILPHPASWNAATPAQRLPDHRALYLTYEGEISNNRGYITRIAQGHALLLAETPTTFHLRLHESPLLPPNCELLLPK